MEAGFTLLLLITFTGLVLLAAALIFWTSPQGTRRIEHLLDVIEKREAALMERISAAGRCRHILIQYTHLHSLTGTHIPQAKR
jgi:hypothetical protein